MKNKYSKFLTPMPKPRLKTKKDEELERQLYFSMTMKLRKKYKNDNNRCFFFNQRKTKIDLILKYLQLKEYLEILETKIKDIQIIPDGILEQVLEIYVTDSLADITWIKEQIKKLI